MLNKQPPHRRHTGATPMLEIAVKSFFAASTRRWNQALNSGIGWWGWG
jgi:hypothetical protein